MAVFPFQGSRLATPATKSTELLAREQVRRKQIVTIILWVVVAFQLAGLPGAIAMHSPLAIGTVVLGLILCGIAMIFNYFGNVAVVSLLLIAVIDLGCGLMLLTSPMGLDTSDLPVFDVLLVSELIAVSLLPAVSVFPVAVSNIVFIILDLTFQPHTMGLDMMLKSNMAYNTVSQPILLQAVVAVISFVWVRSALNALARADRAEEIAELRRREAELQQRELDQRHELDQGVEYLSHVLVTAANGQRNVRAVLAQDNVLWRIGNAINLLLTRLSRANQAEIENQRLRSELFRVSEALHRSRIVPPPPRTVPLQRQFEQAPSDGHTPGQQL